jgi:uncharacterized protein YaiI (UPF0178 family)
MRVLIDADACPVKREAISEARKRGLGVLLVSNTGHSMDRYTSRTGVEAVQVGTGRDAADFAIVERLEAGDVVVTQDTGLAAMVLGRGARAISPRGRVFSAVTIDAELAVRHAEQQHRRSGGRTKGPPVFDEDDRERFALSLSRLLDEASL